MKKLLYIVLTISVFCCKKKQSNINEIVKYYPSKDFFQSNSLVEVDLETPKLEFKEIVHLVNDIHINDSTPYISLKQSDTLIKIMPLRYDWGYKSERNIIRINRDSIYKLGQYPISALYRILKKHYENNGEHPRYAQSTDRAIVEINIDTNYSGLELKRVLKTVLKTFDKINKFHADSLKLNIGLSYFSQIPPPPPLPKNTEDINIGM